MSNLAQAKPYRFNHEQPETRKNISIPADSLHSGYNPQGVALLHAAKHGTPAMLQILLQQPGIDVNAKGCCITSEINSKKIDYHGVTALHIAVAHNDVEKVKLLIQYGADINATNEKGQTPLHVATNQVIIDLLIANGAKINFKDKLDQTPLHFAASRGDVDLVQTLVKQSGIELNAKDNLGNTPLHAAAAMSFEMSQYGQYSFSPAKDLAKTERSDNLSSLSVLIAARAEVNSQNNNGYSPLHLAVMGGYSVWDNPDNSYLSRGHSKLDYQHVLNQVKILCEAGADVNSMTSIAPTESFIWFNNKKLHPAPATSPLLTLYWRESFESKSEVRLASERLNVAKYLISKGANYEDLRYQDNASVNVKKGDTLLHRCAKFSDAEGIRYFSSLGLDINDQISPTHDTPLHSFLYWNSGFIFSNSSHEKAGAEAMLQAGADSGKTKTVKITVDLNTLNRRSGLALLKPVKAAIFNCDNIFAQKAKAMGLVVTSDNCETVLDQIYQTMIEENKSKGMLTFELDVPLTATEYAYTAYQAKPSQKIVDMFKNAGDVQNIAISRI